MVLVGTNASLAKLALSTPRPLFHHKNRKRFDKIVFYSYFFVFVFLTETLFLAHFVTERCRVPRQTVPGNVLHLAVHLWTKLLHSRGHRCFDLRSLCPRHALQEVLVSCMHAHRKKHSSSNNFLSLIYMSFRFVVSCAYVLHIFSFVPS